MVKTLDQIVNDVEYVWNKGINSLNNLASNFDNYMVSIGDAAFYGAMVTTALAVGRGVLTQSTVPQEFKRGANYLWGVGAAALTYLLDIPAPDLGETTKILGLATTGAVLANVGLSFYKAATSSVGLFQNIGANYVDRTIKGALAFPIVYQAGQYLLN